MEAYLKKHYVSSRKKRIFLFKTAAAVFVLINIFLAAERKIMPAVIEISMVEAKQIAAGVIDRCVSGSIEGRELNTGDFFSDNGESFSANTVLINELCADVSESINNEMAEMEKRKVYIPLGSALGIDYFANTGPEIGFYIKQMGKADVEYETEFLTAGINQVNFRVYISVKLDIKTVNPLGSGTVETTRKIVLIDTVKAGKVPNNYINMGK